jgi:hypothetical protein
MCGENEPDIAVYRFNNNGMGGPTQDTIAGILDDVKTELESWSKDDAPITLTITTAKMNRKVYDNLPEFEGY